MKNSEFRQDLVSGDWILFSPGRLKYAGHGTFLKNLKNKPKRKIASLNKCPFEKPLKNVSPNIILSYNKFKKQKNNFKNSDILVLQNHYPVVLHSDKRARQDLKKANPYAVIPGFGHHDLVITKDHNANFPKLSENLAFGVFEIFRDRYLTLFADKNIAYISIFHNWGSLAGASVYHPHYQIIAIPVVPPDALHSLASSASSYKSHKKCVHCVMIDFEKKHKKRIITETENMIAFAPFVSRNPFEVRIFPKKHRPYFENTLDGELRETAEILQRVLKKIEKNLYDPDYNFFIHTAPLKDKKLHSHYHWHIEVYPKLSTRAGFEFSTGIEVNIFDPDLVAEIIRK